jgi:hypothetical protein
MMDASGRAPAYTLARAYVGELEVVDTIVIEIKERLGTNVPVSRRVNDFRSCWLAQRQYPYPRRSAS